MKSLFIFIDKINNKKGFSLVEIIVSLAILVLIVFSLTTLFINSVSGVFAAGYRSEAQYIAQEVIENVIAGGSWNDGDKNVTVVANVVPTFEIVFPETVIKVSGTLYEVKYNKDDKVI